MKQQGHYHYKELEEFELGTKELRVNMNKRGPKPKDMKVGDVKLKVDQSKLHKMSKYGVVEHETASEPFKPAYLMTSERSAGYLSRMHGRCAQNFGH